jgi:hypothetical protein
MHSSFEHLPFERFHRETLPQLIERHGSLVRDDLRAAAPLALRVDSGTAFTYSQHDGAVSVVEGADGAATIVELDEATFSDFANELLTASGTVQTRRARVVAGSLADWQRWEPALRALYEGRPIYDAAAVANLVDRDGRPLDLTRAFTLDDDDELLREFLSTAGYLHIKAAFGIDEIERLAAEVEICRERTTPGDGDSWWSVDASGREVVTRINYLDRFSELLLETSYDPRLLRMARLVTPDMRVCDDRLDGPMVFIKNPRVVQGNGDLGWHVDDGIGGHPVMCPLIQTGIQLDPANASNGQLKLLAGSHRCASHWLTWGEEGDFPVVALDTEPGDLTVHFGDTMHTTPPPTGEDAGRRALYYKFAEPKTFDLVPKGCHYNDVLFAADDSGRVAARAKSWAEHETTGTRYR